MLPKNQKKYNGRKSYNFLNEQRVLNNKHLPVLTEPLHFGEFNPDGSFKVLVTILPSGEIQVFGSEGAAFLMDAMKGGQS